MHRRPAEAVQLRSQPLIAARMRVVVRRPTEKTNKRPGAAFRMLSARADQLRVLKGQLFTGLEERF
jgi:hypothetical protein